MFHERMLFNSPLVTYPPGTARGNEDAVMLNVARDAGRVDDPIVRDLVGEARMLDVVGTHLQKRIGEGVVSGTMPEQSSAVARVFFGSAAVRRTTIAFEIAGAAGGAWLDDDGELAHGGTDFLMRQTACIGGGTTEMARNVVSERVLGMPRERTDDRDTPFRDVPRSPSGR
jgi:alkylation response protein AidB-like acyl-CoA dehydrogenase